MPIRSSISEIEGIQDKKVAQILREMKAVLESIGGRLPNRRPIVPLGTDPTTDGLRNKLNEVINRIQDNG